jgi:nucleotide-binding universal stress UspA family protein
VSYQSILVHVDYTERTNERVKIAIALAQRFTAHLSALAPEGSPLFPYSGGADTFGAYAAEVMEELARLSDVAADRFLETAKLAGLPGYDALACEGDAVYALCQVSRYADLIVVGQTNKEDSTPAKPNDLPEAVMLGSGRPVLIVPYAGHFSTVGQRVLVLWRESRESARAVHDALPFLVSADRVDVIAFSESSTRTGGALPALTDIGTYLARHGAKVNVASEPNVGLSVGEAALSRAADLGSDLIVMGGYGHTRLREWVLGGASRSILEHMTVPVLMSH